MRRSFKYGAIESQPEVEIEDKGILEVDCAARRSEIKDFRTSKKASSCSYTPFDEGGVINAAAYRAFC